MAIGNTGMTGREISVTATSYTLATPDITLATPGRVSVTHTGTTGNPLLYVSFDGATDAMVLRPGTEAGTQHTRGVSYKNIWLKVASGTVVANITTESADAIR